jgi:hypothetical protein
VSQILQVHEAGPSASSDDGGALEREIFSLPPEQLRKPSIADTAHIPDAILAMHLAKDVKFIWLFANVATSFLGTTLNPFFFAIPMLEYAFSRYTPPRGFCWGLHQLSMSPPPALCCRIFVSQKSMLIIEAMAVCGGRLVHTFLLLILLLIFAWAMLILWFDGRLQCSSSHQCLHYMLAIGFAVAGTSDNFIFNGYSVDIFTTYTADDPNSVFNRAVHLIFILLIFVFLNIIFLNLIVGQVVDAFAQLQHNREVQDQDLRNKCLVCSLPRGSFEGSRGDTGGFERHTTTEHNPWHYVLFLVYLSSESEAVLTNDRRLFLQKMRAADKSYLPVLQAHSVRIAKRQKVDAQDELSHKVSEIVRLQQEALRQQEVRLS